MILVILLSITLVDQSESKPKSIDNIMGCENFEEVFRYLRIPIKIAEACDHPHIVALNDLDIYINYSAGYKTCSGSDELSIAAYFPLNKSVKQSRCLKILNDWNKDHLAVHCFLRENEIVFISYSVAPAILDRKVISFVSQLLEFRHILTKHSMITSKESLLTPDQSIALYWRMVNFEMFHLAWNQLSKEFKEKNHQNDLGKYISSMNGLGICSVSLSRLYTTSTGSDSAMVLGTLTFRSKQDCKPSSQDFKFFTVKDSSSWLINWVETNVRQ